MITGLIILYTGYNCQQQDLIKKSRRNSKEPERFFIGVSVETLFSTPRTTKLQNFDICATDIYGTDICGIIVKWKCFIGSSKCHFLPTGFVSASVGIHDIKKRQRGKDDDHEGK